MLRVHKKCNGYWSILDEKVAILWSQSSGNVLAQGRFSKVIENIAVDGHPLAKLLYNVQLEKFFIAFAGFSTLYFTIIF